MLFSKNNKQESLINSQESSISEWLETEEIEEEGQLAIDVFQDEKRIVLQSTIEIGRAHV